MPEYDAIVIGAGHNGLTSASVLAKNSLKVLCVERNGFSGGMASTRELFKGFRHNVGAWALLVFRDEMLKRLGLESYGLEFIRPRSSYCVFGSPDDPPFIGYTDIAEMAGHIMKDHGPDAVQGLARLAEYLKKFKALMEKNMFNSPDSIDGMISGAPDEETRRLLLAIIHGSAMDVLRRFFPDPGRFNCILGSLCASAIDGTHYGPYSAGSGLSLAYHYTMGDEYDFRTPRGGIGALCDALVKSLIDNGGAVQFNSTVTRLLIEKGKITGVLLKNGDRIRARTVLSSLDARTTFLGLIDGTELPTDFLNRVKEINYTNGYIQVHLTLKEPPNFTGHLAFANDNEIRWLMAYIPSPEHLSKCWDQYRSGQVPDEPVSYCAIPSLMDPGLAPEGRYTCTIFSHYFPHDVPLGKSTEFRDLMADRVIGQIAKHAPNFRGSIDDSVVFTNKYFETVFGITGGDFCHGLIHPEQMWDRRPVPGWADYHTPIENLYMCGASCHPGPGITCIPGYNGANEALKIWNR